MRTTLAILLIMVGLAVGVKESYARFFDGERTAFEQKEKAAASGIRSIEVNVATVDVRIVAGGSDQIEARLYGRLRESEQKRYELKKSVNGDVLRLNVDTKGRGSWFGFGTSGSPDLEITLPKQQYEKLAVHSQTGDLTLGDLTANTVDLESSTGDIELDRAKTDKLMLHTSTGDIDLSEIEGEVKAESSTGDVSLELNHFDRNVKIDTKTGDVVVRSGSVPTDFTFDLRSSTGDAAIHLSGVTYDEKDEKQALGRAGSNGGPQLYVHTSTGDINVSR